MLSNFYSVSIERYRKWYFHGGAFLLLCSLFLVSFLVPEQKAATNFFRIIVCFPVFLALSKPVLREFFKDRFVFLFFLLALWTLLSSFWSPDDKILNITGRVLSNLLLVYSIYTIFRFDTDKIKFLDLLYVFAGVGSALLIFLHWDGFLSLDRKGIPYGILYHHAPLSWFFSVCSLVALYGFFKQGKIYFLLLFSLFSVLVVVSQSRGGIVVLLSGLFFLLFFLRAKKTLLFSLLFIVVSTSIVFIGDVAFFERLYERGSAGRFFIYENFFRGVLKSPEAFFFGYGIGADPSNFVGDFKAAHYHNFYFNMWFFTGFIGLLIFLGMMFIWLVRKMKARVLTAWDAPVLAMSAGFLFDGGRLFGYPDAMMFCFLIPLFFSYFSLKDERVIKN